MIQASYPLRASIPAQTQLLGGARTAVDENRICTHHAYADAGQDGVHNLLAVKAPVRAYARPPLPHAGTYQATPLRATIYMCAQTRGQTKPLAGIHVWQRERCPAGHGKGCDRRPLCAACSHAPNPRPRTAIWRRVLTKCRGLAGLLLRTVDCFVHNFSCGRTPRRSCGYPALPRLQSALLFGIMKMLYVAPRAGGQPVHSTVCG